MAERADNGISLCQQSLWGKPMSPVRLRLATTLAVVAPLLCGPPAGAQTSTSPPPGDLGGKQPSSTAASNIGTGDTHTVWSPSLPVPPIDDEAPPSAFLDAAQKAIAANRTGEAQEALERAESRALSRSVRPSRAGEPSRQPLVQQIAKARAALGTGDRLGSLRIIQAAMADPEASEAD
jgi:hypothetical protein